MRTLILSLIFLISTFVNAYAESAADMEALPEKEFMRLMEDYELELSTIEKKAALDLAATLPADSKPEREALLVKLRDPAAKVPFPDIFVFSQQEGSQALFSKLALNPDPLLRFVANLELTGAGDTEAAQHIYDLIHSEELTHQQKRWLCTWCGGVGIRVKADTAESIFEHIRSAMNHEPKFKSGDAAPEFDAKDAVGKTLSLTQLAGKVVLLHFWATSCGPCMGEMESLKLQLKDYSPEKVAIIFVSLDEDRQVFDDAIKKLELPFHQVFDGAGWGGKLARAYGINTMPFNVIIDEKGIVRSNDISEIPNILANEMNKKH